MLQNRDTVMEVQHWVTVTEIQVSQTHKEKCKDRKRAGGAMKVEKVDENRESRDAIFYFYSKENVNYKKKKTSQQKWFLVIH